MGSLFCKDASARKHKLTLDIRENHKSPHLKTLEVVYWSCMTYVHHWVYWYIRCYSNKYSPEGPIHEAAKLLDSPESPSLTGESGIFQPSMHPDTVTKKMHFHEPINPSINKHLSSFSIHWPFLFLHAGVTLYGPGNYYWLWIAASAESFPFSANW